MDKKTSVNIIFYLDGTLVDDNYQLFPIAKEILYYLHKIEVPIYIASFNEDAHKILERNGIDFIVKCVAGYNGGKRLHKNQFLNELGVDKDISIFFDDEIANCKNCNDHGWKTVHVKNPYTGVTWEVITPFIDVAWSVSSKSADS